MVALTTGELYGIVVVGLSAEGYVRLTGTDTDGNPWARCIPRPTPTRLI